LRWNHPHVTVRTMTLAFCSGCAVLTMPGCGGGSATGFGSPAHVVSSRSIAAPRGTVFETPVWLSGPRRLVVMLVPPGRGTDGAYWHLFSMRLDGSGLKRLPLPRQAGCKLTSHEGPDAYSASKIAYVQQCWGQEIPHNAKYARTYDLSTGRVGYLRRYSLVVSAGRVAVSRFGQVVANDGRGLSERLLRLGRSGARPLALPFVRVGYPSWSPDGRKLALDAIPSTEHAEGLRRLDLPRSLYLLDRRGRVLRRLLSGLSGASRAAWSPDGRWLAIALQPRHEPRGLYLIDVSRQTAHLVAHGDFGGVTWIGHHRLAAAVGVCADLPGRHGRVGLRLITLARRVH
jgi:hypothetical protein